MPLIELLGEIARYLAESQQSLLLLAVAACLLAYAKIGSAISHDVRPAATWRLATYTMATLLLAALLVVLPFAKYSEAAWSFWLLLFVFVGHIAAAYAAFTFLLVPFYRAVERRLGKP